MIGTSMSAVVTAIGGVVIALVILLVVLSGRMSKRARAGLELIVGVLMYPTVTALWGWQAYQRFGDGDWIYAGLMSVATVVMTTTGIYAIRRRTLAPFAKSAK